MIARSQTEEEHLDHLQKLFERLKKYKLRLNPNKCTFGIISGKLLGFIVSGKGIEVDLTKVNDIQEIPTPRIEKEVRGFLGRLNYIARFISHLTATCEPIFKLLKKDQARIKLKFMSEGEHSNDNLYNQRRQTKNKGTYI